MKLYAPLYYKNFKCIADRCEHSCCVGWEIDIDENTLEKYKNLNSGYGAVINESISYDNTPHFKLCDKDRCPHLDGRGLCKIILNEGEDCLCDICREHPRFYNFTSVCEVGVGLSCPEAARVVLSSPDYDVFEKIGETHAQEDEVLFDGRAERKKIYSVLKNADRPYSSRLEKIYKDYGIDILEDSRYLGILDSIEYLDGEHKTLFMNYSRQKRPEGVDEYLERFLAYLIYRHTTEAFDEADLCERLSFCLFCERLLASLLCIKEAVSKDEVAELARIISEEIEYSEENTAALMY